MELTSGRSIRVWRGDDGQSYFCHGLTFGGKEAPGGPVSPFSGAPVEAILQAHYRLIPESRAGADDILVWKGPAPDTTPHSAILIDPATAPGEGRLAYSARLRTKNGMWPETTMSLEQLIETYGESYNAYQGR